MASEIAQRMPEKRFDPPPDDFWIAWILDSYGPSLGDGIGPGSCGQCIGAR
jgi:hypothetical protein